MRQFTENFGCTRPAKLLEPYGNNGVIVRENLREEVVEEEGVQVTHWVADSTIYTTQEYLVLVQERLNAQNNE